MAADVKDFQALLFVAALFSEDVIPWSSLSLCTASSSQRCTPLSAQLQSSTMASILRVSHRGALLFRAWHLLRGGIRLPLWVIRPRELPLRPHFGGFALLPEGPLPRELPLRDPEIDQDQAWRHRQVVSSSTMSTQ